MENPTKILLEKSPTILLAEDEDILRRVITRRLASGGFRVLSAANGKEALELSDQNPGAIHLLISDLVMPDMDGVELASQIKKKNPEALTLFMSGYPHDVLLQRGLLKADQPFIEKSHVTHGIVAKAIHVLYGKIAPVN